MRRTIVGLICFIISACADDDMQPPSRSLPLHKGMTLAAWDRTAYASDEARSDLDSLKALGVNAIAVIPTLYQNSLQSHRIYIHPQKTPADSSLRSIIRDVHTRGMSVMLKLHVDVVDGQSRTLIDPDHDELWSALYHDFLIAFAVLAEEEDVEVMCLGTELKFAETNGAMWDSLIFHIRQVYAGHLTYAANWDSYRRVVYWDRLDFAGVDAFFPLTDESNPSWTALRVKWNNIAHDLAEFSSDVGRPILLTEIGYRSMDGANREPWNYEMTGLVDLDEQADCYEAALSALRDQAWLQGLYWWNRTVGIEEMDTDYGIESKPAEAVLRIYYLDTNWMKSRLVFRLNVGYTFLK